MKKYSFHTAYTQLRELYGVEIGQNEFETLGLIAWGKIGNNNVKLYKYIVAPEQNELGEYFINLPCNVNEIESITAGYEDYQDTSSSEDYPLHGNKFVEGYIESRKSNTNHLYASGKYIKYRQEGNIIYLSEKFNKVIILYKGYVVDEDGLPELSEDEMDAIAAFCAYSHDFKEARMTKDKATFEMSQIMKQEWLRKCNQARVPSYISQNDMDEILNVASSWDRKRFGKSFKPLR